MGAEASRRLTEASGPRQASSARQQPLNKMLILSQDFAGMDGKKPAPFLGRFDENGEQARRSRAWQSWIAHGRGPINLLDEFASMVDQLC